MASWTVAAACVRGLLHERLGMPCQDANLCRVISSDDGRDVLFALAADGASSAARSEHGAARAVASFFDEFAKEAKIAPALATITREAVERWVGRLQGEIAELAREACIGMREYSCTFLGAIAGPESTVCVQVGDGAIVGAPDPGGPYRCLTWPQHGRSSVSTFFITGDDGLDRLVVDFIDEPMTAIAVFTDGIEDLVLDKDRRTARPVPFQALFQALSTKSSMADHFRCSFAAEFLSSTMATDISDDDKTLVLARRT